MFFILGFIFVIVVTTIGSGKFVAQEAQNMVRAEEEKQDRVWKDALTDRELEKIVNNDVAVANYNIDPALKQWLMDRLWAYRDEYPEICREFLCRCKDGQYRSPWDCLDEIEKTDMQSQWFNNPFERLYDYFLDMVMMTCGKFPEYRIYMLMQTALKQNLSFDYGRTAQSSAQYIREHGIPALTTPEEYIEESHLIRTGSK